MKTVGFIVFFFIFIHYFTHIYTFNYTTSYPRGLYLNLFSDAEKGDLIAFCPDEKKIFKEALERGYMSKGFCPSGTEKLIKKIFAIESDFVNFTDQGVYVNDRLIKNSKPEYKDSKGREMSVQKGKIQLKAGEVLVLSDYNPGSFDGRYFGVIKSSNILNKLKIVINLDK